MSNLDDPLFVALLAAEADYKAAGDRLAEATKAAFPIDSLVTSFHLSKRGCVCRVTAHGHAWSSPGELVMRNTTTLKAHRTSPTTPRFGADYRTQIGHRVELVCRPGAEA